MEINSDFRASIHFEQLMQNPTIHESDKVGQALELYYPSVPGDLQQAIDRMLWFYRAGKDESPGSGKKQVQIYSFSHDDEYIYAAFLDQYGVDLQDVPYLHWWKFKAMFRALKADNEIVKIMGYRAAEIPKDMSKEQKQFYKDMKRLYAIPLAKTEREKLSAIEAALLNGGDLRGVL